MPRHDVYCDECGDRITKEDYDSCEECNKVLCDDEVCQEHHFCEQSLSQDEYASNQYQSRIKKHIIKNLI